MKGEGKKKEELVKELVELHERVAELEKSETGRKQAEKELKAANQQLTASEQQLRERNNYLESLINYANAPIIVWDPESKISRFNHAFEHLTGYKADEVIGQELSMLFPEASRDESLHNIARTLSGKYWKRVEIPILCKDGKVRLVLWNSANIYAEDGKTLLSIIAQGQDITERKKAEEALKESEEKYRTLVETAQEGICIDDKNDNITFTNKAFADMLGYERNEIIGMNFRELVDKRQIPELEKQTKMRMEGKSSKYEITLYTKNGKPCNVIVSAAPLVNVDGNYEGSISVNLDITERKKAEEEREYQRNYFQALFKDSPEGIVSLDDKHRVIDINPTFEEMFGYHLKDLQGKEIDDYVIPERFLKEGKAYTKRALSGKTVKAETIRKRKDGSEVPVSILGAPIFIDGKEVGIFTIYRDITERKEAEEKLQKAYKEVKRALEQEKVFKLKTAHYFFNPLCIAKGYIDLTMEELPEEQREKLKAARHAIERVEKVVENVTQRGEIRE